MCPVHDFMAPDGEIIAVYVEAKAPVKQHQQQKRRGKVFKRVYEAPRAARDTKTGDATKEDFFRTTEGKNLKVRDLQDISEEMHKHRADKNGGRDPVREAFYRRYEKENGEKHASEVQREAVERANAKLADFGIKIDPSKDPGKIRFRAAA